MSSKRRMRLRSAVFNELWQAKRHGQTLRGYTATARARRAIASRGHPTSTIDTAGLEELDKEGSLVVVRGSRTALLDAELTITDEAFRARMDRQATMERHGDQRGIAG